MIARQIGRNGPSAAPITTRVASRRLEAPRQPRQHRADREQQQRADQERLAPPDHVRPAADQERAERPGQRQARVGPAELLVAELEVVLHERREEGERHAVEVGEAERQPEQHHHAQLVAAVRASAGAVAVSPYRSPRFVVVASSRFGLAGASRRSARLSIACAGARIRNSCDRNVCCSIVTPLALSARRLRAAPFVAQSDFGYCQCREREWVAPARRNRDTSSLTVR